MQTFTIKLTEAEAQLIEQQLRLVDYAPQYDDVQAEISSVLDKLARA